MISSDILVVKYGSIKASKQIFTETKHNLPHLIVLIVDVVVVIVHLKTKTFPFFNRLFGATGICSQCLKTILPLDMVMRAREHIYHLDCFACQVCRYRFCVGDKFYLHFNAVLCEDHYYDVRGYFYQTPFFA